MLDGDGGSWPSARVNWIRELEAAGFPVFPVFPPISSIIWCHSAHVWSMIE